MKLTISDTFTVDGTYEYDESYFTNFELHAIKRLTDLTPGEFEQALDRKDTDIVVCLAMVALMRNGRISTITTPWTSPEVAAIWGISPSSITLDMTEQEEAVQPDPPELAVVEQPNGDGSGETSEDLSGLQVFARNSIGTQD